MCLKNGGKMEQDKGVRLSVVIPVYNSEKYLERCVDSVISQLSVLQLILVNDGSTDNSGLICDNYAVKYENIQVIHKKNEGVSVARQLGLSKTIGEYVTFVDSDDWLEPNAYKYMIDEADNANADVVWCGRIDVENGKSKSVYHPIEEDPSKCLKAIFQRTMHGSVCNKIFRRSLLVKNKVHFPKKYNYCEDWSFCIQVFLKAKKVKFLHRALYNYYQHDESTLHTLDKQKLIDRFNVFTYTLDLVPDNIKLKLKPAISYDISKFILEAMKYGLFSLEEIRQYYKSIHFDIDPLSAPGLSFSRKRVIHSFVNNGDFLPKAHMFIKHLKLKVQRK